MKPKEWTRILKQRWRQLESFLRRDLWVERPSDHVRPWLQGSLRFFILVAREFRRDDLLTRASALTYIALLALVPILTVMFVAFRGLELDRIEDDLIEKVFVNLQLDTVVTSEAVKSVGTFIRETVNEINFKALGVAGLLGLIFTSVMAIGSVEESFNRIWSVTKGRSIWRRFSDYLSVLIVGPLLVFFTLTQSVQLVKRVVGDTFGFVGFALSVGNIIVSHLGPLLISTLAFTFVYIFLPYTRVKLTSALFGGFLAGLLWHISQWAYVEFQIGVARYSALYGTLSALPIFLVWLFLSWVILLLGAEATYCFQHYRRLSREFLDVELSEQDRESVAMWITARVIESFVLNKPRWTVTRLSDALHLRDSVTAEIVEPLIERNILAFLSGEQGELVPGHDPSAIRLSDVVQAMRTKGDRISDQMPDELYQRVVHIEDRLTRLGTEEADRSFLDLIQDSAK